jgi:hypothetical protein
MSEYTFNIADYRPLSASRAQTMSHDRASGGPFADGPQLSRDHYSPEAALGVVDIRSLRNGQRFHHLSESIGTYQRRGKVLRFRSDGHSRVYEMRPCAAEDRGNDTDPLNFPPAA